MSKLEISGLAAAASAVEDEIDVEAREGGAGQRRSSSSSSRRRSIVAFVVILLSIGGVVIGLSVGLSKNNNSSNSASSQQGNAIVDDKEDDGVNNTPSSSHMTSPPTTTTITTARPSVEAPGMMTRGSYYPTSVSSGGEEAGSLYQEDGTCSNNNSSTTVIADITISNFALSCAYIVNQTVFVVAPVLLPDSSNAANSVIVEKKLSGGNSAFDDKNAVIVSYNSNGTAGAVWVLGYNHNTTGSQQQQGMWEQTGILQTDYEDQLGWSVAIKGNTFVVGAPGFQGREVPLTQSDGWYWSGRGNAIVMTKNDDAGAGASWVRQKELIPGVADDTAGFGNSVDIAGRLPPKDNPCFTHVAFPFHNSHISIFLFVTNISCFTECECLIAVG